MALMETKPTPSDALDKRNELFAAAAEAASSEQAQKFHFVAAFYFQRDIKFKGFYNEDEAEVFFENNHITREDRVILDVKVTRDFVLMG